MSENPRVPARLFYGESCNLLISSLEVGVRTLQQRNAEQNWEGRTVLGYKLPSWQRDYVWTDKQCVNFIESVYLGANLGAFMVNETFKDENCDGILLDGQQRLRAIEKYLAGELAVAGEDGVERTWNDLTEEDRAHFRRITFPCIRTRYDNEAVLKEAYDRHNFSGTPHNPEERAGGEGYRAEPNKSGKRSPR